MLGQNPPSAIVDRSNVMVLSQTCRLQLRIRDEDFDNDTFLSVSEIRDISKLVGDEFEKRYPSLIGGAS